MPRAQSSLAGATRPRSNAAKVNLDLAKQNLKRQQELWKDGLTTREALERAQNERGRVREAGPAGRASRRSRRASSRSSRKQAGLADARSTT